jgi:hypothetical protein
MCCEEMAKNLRSPRHALLPRVPAPLPPITHQQAPSPPPPARPIAPPLSSALCLYELAYLLAKGGDRCATRAGLGSSEKLKRASASVCSAHLGLHGGSS